MEQIGINKRTALKMFWDAGWNNESKLIQANSIIESIPQAVQGYWLADDISKAIKENKQYA